MTRAPSSDEKNAYIQRKVADLAQAQNVKIILAIESGSRAWGFPSADSDYDVRFIYRRATEEYLAVEPVRDVIESDLASDIFLGVPLDLNGWDLRKTLQLALKSNAVVVEWLSSPVVYSAEPDVVARLLRFAAEAADLAAFEYHYDRLARHTWDDIRQGSGPVRLKKYFYALRPAIALTWIRCFAKTPPMNMLQAMQNLDLPDGFLRAVHQLIDNKAIATEADMTERNAVIDDFLEKTLGEKTPERPAQISHEQAKLEGANRLFLDIIR